MTKNARERTLLSDRAAACTFGIAAGKSGEI
jgi:hypothetical protein